MTNQTAPASRSTTLTEMVNVGPYKYVRLEREPDGHIRVQAWNDCKRVFCARDDEDSWAAAVVDDVLRQLVIEELVDLDIDLMTCREKGQSLIEQAVWNVTHNDCTPEQAARIVLDIVEVG